MTIPVNIAAAVLAGGEGSRIGGSKPLVLLGGKTLLERACEQVGGWSDRPIISIRSSDQLAQPGAPWITDAPGIEGPLAGLAAALDWARRERRDALLTIPCDMPFLPQELAVRLQEEIGEKRAAVAGSGGHLHPVCSLWRTNVLAQIPAYCASGKRSLRGFAAHVGFMAVEWATEPYDPFFNINSRRDLEIAEEMLRR